MRVKIYTTKTCAYCPTVKKWLQNKHIDFDVIDITYDPAMGNDLFKRSGHITVPVVEYKDKFVAGIQWGKLAELLTA